MATAITQLGLDHSGSQLLNSTHWDACCSNDELCSDASSNDSSEQLLKPTWQSLYIRCPRTTCTGGSTQAQAAAGCFALHQHQCQPLQLPRDGAAEATEEHLQQCSSTPPPTPGGMPVPAARYLQLSCEPLAGIPPACPTTEGPETPLPAPDVAGAAGCPAEQAASGSDSRRQLQQWLARREASVTVNTAAGSTRRSSDSSSDSAAVEGLSLPGPAVELARALPPPAFLILGVLG